ncbi:MAG: transposase, partial [Acidobacteriota bacterium]
RALRDIQACRTAALGGHLEQCDHCGEQIYAYHSCRNRHCPKCQGDRSRDWLERQGAALLPCSYYLLTFTLPHSLRALAYAHQRRDYGAMLRCAAAALQALAADPRYLGARPACLAVLHTWTRTLLYHPHVHLLVSAGGLAPDDGWVKPKNPAFLVPVRALSVLFRAKLCHALARQGLLSQAPPPVWKRDWVVHCQPADRGRRVLGYLGRYIFRVALSNSRLERIDQGQVTFRYRDSRSHRMRRVTLPAHEFLHRLLLHVLPRGCVRVRYYGLWSHACRPQLQRARTLLQAASRQVDPAPPPPDPSPADPPPELCPYCGIGHLIRIQTLPPSRKVPPRQTCSLRIQSPFPVLPAPSAHPSARWRARLPSGHSLPFAPPGYHALRALRISPHSQPELLTCSLKPIEIPSDRNRAQDLLQPRILSRLRAPTILNSLGRPTENWYTLGMTQTLDAAIAKLAAMPPEEQDRVGRWLLDELRDEERWAQQFAASQDALGKLAAEARAERTAGRATDLDPEKL